MPPIPARGEKRGEKKGGATGFVLSKIWRSCSTHGGENREKALKIKGCWLTRSKARSEREKEKEGKKKKNNGGRKDRDIITWTSTSARPLFRKVS